MDIIARFQRAMQPNPPRCIGLQLLPYSLGHHLALQEMDNAFLDLDRQPSYDDLVSGVLACSLGWSGWLEAKHSKMLPRFLKAWGKKVGNFDIEGDCERFQMHVRDGESFPETNQKPGRNGNAVCPWENRLKVMLMQKLGLSEIEVLDRPLQESFVDWCTIGESEGIIEMFSAYDEAFLKFHKERMAELAANPGN